MNKVKIKDMEKVKKEMKIKLLIQMCILSLLYACTNQVDKNKSVINPVNELNKQKADSAQKVAEFSTEKISELPLNYSFSMTEDEFYKHSKKLVEKNILTKIGDNYYYKYITNKGVNVEFYVDGWFYEDRLYDLQFRIGHDFISDSIFKAIDEDLISKFDSTYKRIGYWKDYPERKERIVINDWFKGNQIIEYITFNPPGYMPRINYYNAPIKKITSEISYQKLQDESRARSRMKEAGIENNTYDGSVSKVEAYLKSNLKDPKSYESVEWSNVTPTDNGYMVRHKYRAKNSFGAYELMNQVFYLDGNGEVIAVSDYK